METTQLIRTSWGTLTFASMGIGEPVVLLHPLALSGKFWAPLATELATRFRVVTIDARGHGNSRWDGSEFSIDDLAQDVSRVIDELGLKRIGLIGMSMGGCVAIIVAASRPDRVRALVLADTTADYGPAKAERWAERERYALTTPRAEQLSFQVDRWFSPSFAERERYQADVQHVCDVFLATDSRAHAVACRALGSFGATTDLESISSPTLVVVGEEDHATPLAMAEVLQSGIATSSLEVIHAARHFALIEAKLRLPFLIDRILEFIS
jgi:3-oxoadipate enol-lactonase